MRFLLIFLIVFIYSNSRADYYEAPLQLAEWALMESKTACQLKQKIPYYGSADFLHTAGKELQFSIQEQRKKAAIVKASLAVRPAPWRHDVMDQATYDVYSDATDRHQANARLVVYGDIAELMLDALLQGNYPTFTYVREASRAPVEETKVAVSSVNFSKAYESFVVCRKNLFPFAVEDIKRNRIYFNLRSKFLNRKAGDELRKIAEYLNKTPEIKVYIVSDTANLGVPDKKWFELRAGVIQQNLEKLNIGSDRLIVSQVLPEAVSERDVTISVLAPDALRLYMYKKRSIRLSPLEQSRLNLLAEYIKEFFVRGTVLIRSYTDSEGSRKSNYDVSLRRGEAVKNYLVQQGVPASQLQVKAYGETRPVKSNRFETGRAQNRRVVIDFMN